MFRKDKALLVVLLSFTILNCRDDLKRLSLPKVMAITESGQEMEADYYCQGKAIDPSSDKLPKISWGGKVMDWFGEKISDATVSLIGLNISSVSDTDGNVILEGVPAQTRVDIHIETPPYIIPEPYLHGLKSIATFNFLTPSVTTLDFTFYLAYFPIEIKPFYPYVCFVFPFFTGLIRDCNNNSIVNATITFEDLEGNEVKNSIVWYEATEGCDSSKAGSMTSSQGIFHGIFWISNIPPGEFNLKAWGVLNKKTGKQVLLGKIKIISFPDTILMGIIEPN